MLGDEPKLGESLRSGMFGDGAELSDQRTDCAALDFHVHVDGGWAGVEEYEKEIKRIRI